jgi:hypothetical protein
MSVHPLISPAADQVRQRERLFFESMMRILDREMPGYAE